MIDNESRPTDRPAPASARLVPPSRRLIGRMERLCLKELREILRDRRTLVTLFAMPLLVYPLLSMVFHRSLVASWSGGSTRLLIGADTEQGLRMLMTLLANPSDGTEGEQRELDTGFALPSPASGTSPVSGTVTPASPGRSANGRGESGRAERSANDESASRPSGEGIREGGANAPAVGDTTPLAPGEMLAPQGKPEINWQYVQDVRGQVAAGALDLGVKVRRRLAAADSGPPTVRFYEFELFHRKGSMLSDQALDLVDRRLQELNQALLLRRLAEVGVVAELPAQASRVAVGDEAGPVSLASLIPLVLILMTVTGAVYPAIDLTAGERERGTMEMLMAAPVPRLALLLAKYVAVVVVATLTATVNLCAMMLTLAATGLTTVVFGSQGVTLVLVCQFFSLLILFASFFSAVLLAVTSNARSFKEAQAYLIPLMLLSLGPGVMSLLPGLQFNGLLAIAPVANMVMLARDLSAGQVDPVLAVVAVLSTFIYTGTAIAIAARIFGMDAVLYGGQANWSDFLRGQSWGRPRQVPTVSGALSCLAVLFPLYFLVSNSLAQLRQQSLSVRLIGGAVATIFLFGGIPWLAARLQQLSIRDCFQLHRPRVGALAGGAVLGVSLWPFAHEVFWLSEFLGLQTLNEQMMKAIEQMLREYAGIPLPLILLTMAVVPAICEEFFFRGFLFSALRNATSKAKTITISALLFGAFHVFTSSLLAPERFLPSSFLGLVLGWVCWRTRSLFPGIVLHVTHNGLLLAMAYYRDELAAAGWGSEEQTHLPLAWLLLGAGGALVGIGLIRRADR